jgi:hypothetical protein
MSAASTDQVMSSYRLPDEPRPGRLERLVSDPIWPLFATMLAGAWLGLPWFAFNAFALGSPTRWRELAWAMAAALGAGALLVAAMLLVNREIVPRWAGHYLGLLPIAWKLGISYWLLTSQRRAFALWEHYGGQARRGVMVLVAGMLLGRQVGAGLHGWAGFAWLVLR